MLDTELNMIIRVNQQCASLCDRSPEALVDELIEGLPPDGWCPRTPLETLIER